MDKIRKRQKLENSQDSWSILKKLCRFLSGMNEALVIRKLEVYGMPLKFFLV